MREKEYESQMIPVYMNQCSLVKHTRAIETSAPSQSLGMPPQIVVIPSSHFFGRRCEFWCNSSADRSPLWAPTPINSPRVNHVLDFDDIFQETVSHFGWFTRTVGHYVGFLGAWYNRGGQWVTFQAGPVIARTPQSAASIFAANYRIESRKLRKPASNTGRRISHAHSV